MQLQTAIYIRSSGTSEEPTEDLRRDVEARGDVMVAVFADQTPRRYAGWRSLMASLDRINQIALHDVGDLPGRTVTDLLAILARVTAHGVSIAVPTLGIDTSEGTAAVIALTAAYRRAKKSAAIKRGQERARKVGRRIGRPPIPITIRRQILAELANDAGLRPLARKYGISPASVSTIKKSMDANPDGLAA